MSVAPLPIPQPEGRSPVWEIALLLPDQGSWTDAEYLDFTRHSRGLVEFTDGQVEVLPVPTKKHQKLVWWLARQIENALGSEPGAEFITAPYKLRIREGKFREPDILVILAGTGHVAGEDFATGADLVVEVVSEDRPERDYRTKRADYAEAGIREYWIVDPQKAVVKQLVLNNGSYVEAGSGRENSRLTSTVLSALTVDVASCFGAAK